MEQTVYEGWFVDCVILAAEHGLGEVDRKWHLDDPQFIELYHFGLSPREAIEKVFCSH